MTLFNFGYTLVPIRGLEKTPPNSNPRNMNLYCGVQKMVFLETPHGVKGENQSLQVALPLAAHELRSQAQPSPTPTKSES